MSISQALDAFQITARDFVLSMPGCALFFDQGTGKTYIASGVVESLALTDPSFCALAIVPLTNLESSWVKTLSLISGLTICRTFDELKAAPCPKLFLLNFEGMLNKKLLNKMVAFKKWTFAFVDEAQRIKARGSKASRAMRRLRFIPKRLILTGTPMDKDPQEIWPQLRFACPDALGNAVIDTVKGRRTVCVGDVWEGFDQTYLIKTGFMNKERKFRESMRAQFNELVGAVCLHVDRYDVIPGLQKPLLIRERFELLGSQDRIYREMENNLFTEIKPGQFSTAELKVTSIMRLQQIVGGFLVDDDGTLHAIGEAKMRRVRSLIKTQRVKPPFVVFCRFKAEIDALRRELRQHYDRVRVLSGATGKGKTKSATRAVLNEEFQSGRIDVLIVQTKTGGVGIDLFEAFQAICYSVSHSFIDFDQVVARLVRRGQTRQCEFFLLEACDTIDTDIYLSIDEKCSISRAFLNRLKRK